MESANTCEKKRIIFNNEADGKLHRRTQARARARTHKHTQRKNVDKYLTLLQTKRKFKNATEIQR